MEIQQENIKRGYSRFFMSFFSLKLRVLPKVRIPIRQVIVFAILLSLPAHSVLSRVNVFRPEFRDIEIRDFLKTMSQITGKNILIDDSIKGKITIVSHKDIPVEEAFNFMKDVLEVRGYVVVDTGSFIKVIRMEDADGSVIPDSLTGDEISAGIVSKVIRLPYSMNANDVNNLLRSVLDKQTKLAVYRPTNSLVITGYASSVTRAYRIIDEIASDGKNADGMSSNDTIHIYRLKNLPADSVAQVLVRLDMPDVEMEEEGGADGKKVATARNKRNEKIKAVAHKESNSLIVTASSAEWNEIYKIIDSLDRLRKQILLEVLIAEVTSSSLNDFGIDWRYQGPDAAHAQFNTGYAAQGNLVDPDTGTVTGNNTLSGFSLGFLDRGGDLLGIFNANMNNSNFNVLSAPQVLTLDNQEAEINVGQDVPVQTQQRTSGGGTSQATVNSYEYRPSGIKLKFTPHVSDTGKIALDLFTEVTNIEGGASLISNPTFNKRNVKTYVTVQDRQTIVIGGLVSTERLQAIQKIPLLGDIPLLGFFFRRTTYTKKRVNLMVFITPHILNNQKDADRITIYKRNIQIRESRANTNKHKLWPDPEVPRSRQDD